MGSEVAQQREYIFRPRDDCNIQGKKNYCHMLTLVVCTNAQSGAHPLGPPFLV